MAKYEFKKSPLFKAEVKLGEDYHEFNFRKLKASDLVGDIGDFISSVTSALLKKGDFDNMKESDVLKAFEDSGDRLKPTELCVAIADALLVDENYNRYDNHVEIVDNLDYLDTKTQIALQSALFHASETEAKKP